MKSAIQSLDLSYFIHATEDPEKVNFAVAKLLGTDATFESQDMAGHFGNAIREVGVHLHGVEAEDSLGRLVSSLPGSLREELVRDIDKLVDEHSSLFIRIDKQKLVEGELVRGSNDVVRIKVKPRGFVMKGKAREFFVGLLTAK